MGQTATKTEKKYATMNVTNRGTELNTQANYHTH